jgi:hypothetical protein
MRDEAGVAALKAPLYEVIAAYPIWDLRLGASSFTPCQVLANSESDADDNQRFSRTCPIRTSGFCGDSEPKKIRRRGNLWRVGSESCDDRHFFRNCLFGPLQ